jgi:hypothetical protein
VFSFDEGGAEALVKAYIRQYGSAITRKSLTFAK